MEITGRHLIEKGYKPGKWFKEALQEINSKNLSDDELDEFLKKTAPHIIEPFNEALSFNVNIEAETEEEISNVESVLKTMNELMKTPTLVDGAIMPDACPTGRIGEIPVGGIVVSKNAIHPAMHSADICCSVMMTNLGTVEPKDVLNAAHSITHFGGGGRNDRKFSLPKPFEEELKENSFTGNESAIMSARQYLGTQGDGNHFLYVGQLESTGETILVTHHGSRGLGAKVYKQGVKLAERFRKEISPHTIKYNAWIPFDDPVGKEYWNALQLVRKWTKLNHSVLHDDTAKILNKDPHYRFWNEHNFVFRDGEHFYHAKGATPLEDKFVPDSYEGLRLIPLNMSEPVLIIKGKKTDNNLGFAPHGAGRDVSRSQHIRKHSDRTIQEIFREETKGLDIRFYSGHIDISELPSAYKNAHRVQKQMKKFNLGKVMDRIIPYGSIMAGNWQIDAPWRKRKRKNS